jgi:hypothetical protein
VDICYPETTDWSCRFTADELTTALEDPVMAAKIRKSEAFAWSLLAALTAYRIGTCPVTVRPCAARCAPQGSYNVAPASGRLGGVLAPLTIGLPYISGGVWYNSCGCRPQSCSCTSMSEIILPGPVGSIVEVRLDGATLDRSLYVVYNGGRLARTDGETWPICQDMTLSDADGFSVKYYRGSRPNVMTNAAAGALANEFLLSCMGEDCRLPGNVTSVTTPGATYNFDDAQAQDGFGIPEVQAVIRIYNPYGLKAEPIVASPDMYETATRTWH